MMRIRIRIIGDLLDPDPGGKNVPKSAKTLFNFKIIFLIYTGTENSRWKQNKKSNIYM